jgi:sialic acid synthase SpsE
MKKNIHNLLEENKTLFLPDIGTFFNDDVDVALTMVDKLVEANIPVIKAEILHDVNICLESDLSEFYYSSSKQEMIEENYRQVIERKIVSLDSYKKIFGQIREKGCEFVVSVYDNKGAEFAVEQGAIALKIASSNITHQPLIEHVAKMKSTIILDTGHSTLEEISCAVNWANDAGAFDIIVQHSPLAPPVPVDEHNLKFMQTLGNCFDLPYGLSDHHIGEEMLYAATALGASIVEKGVCPDELGDEQDRAHALNISQAVMVQKKISNIARGLGNGVRHLERHREKYRSRMGLVAKMDIANGETLSDKNIGYAFPVMGLAVEHVEFALGRKVKRSITAGQPIKLTDL